MTLNPELYADVSGEAHEGHPVSLASSPVPSHGHCLL